VPDEDLRELCEQLRVLGEVIGKVAVVDEAPPAAPAPPAPPAPDGARLAQRVCELAALLADDDYRACEVWRELTEPLRGALGTGVVDEIARLIAVFDLSAAHCRLRESGAPGLAGAC